MKAAIEILRWILFEVDLSGDELHARFKDISSIRQALAILEASEKVGAKKYLLEYVNDEINFQMNRGDADIGEALNELRALLESLPDQKEET